MVKFVPWFAEGNLPKCCFEIGVVEYGTDGIFKLELLTPNICEIKFHAHLVFEAPLAIRITQEGSLMEYWNSGFAVKEHGVFIATSSKFMEWLAHSSSGVHSADRVRHYAVFSDDVCVEILSSAEPVISECFAR
ncbi:MAG: hypothetical protein LBP52_06510 [Burkholderiaceae bacterium]|jgi:hypothetical protein|nr:hypothetical protein [Burkholderiaceae bacterium]